jgi:uncharacterized membrane protein YwaF
MEGFFGHEYSKYPFTFLSNEHLIVLLAFFFLTFVLYRLRSQIFKYDLWIRSALFITLFSLEILYHFWLVRGGNWDITYTLPFQLCSISLIISLILLMTNSRVSRHRFVLYWWCWCVCSSLNPRAFFRFPPFSLFSIFYYPYGNHLDSPLFCLGERVLPGKKECLGGFPFFKWLFICCLLGESLDWWELYVFSAKT